MLSSSSSKPARPRVDLVLFDVFDTLLRPRQPPHVQYALEGRRILLPALSQDGASSTSATADFFKDDAVKARFVSAFRSLSKEHPNYGKASEPRMHPDQWWEAVIRRTFDVRTLDPTSSSGLEERMGELVQRLLTRFATAEAYELYEDVEPSLRALSIAARDSPDSLPRLGVASNSDERILSVLRDLGCDEFLGVTPQGEEMEPAKGRGVRDQQGRATPTLSYSIGFAKPDPNFFRLAVLRAYPFLESEDGEPTAEALRRACERTLYVGDSFEEDYLGATRAGLKAFWLDRSRQGGGNQPSFGSEGQDEEPDRARIQSLTQAVDWALTGPEARE